MFICVGGVFGFVRVRFIVYNEFLLVYVRWVYDGVVNVLIVVIFGKCG